MLSSRPCSSRLTPTAVNLNTRVRHNNNTHTQTHPATDSQDLLGPALVYLTHDNSPLWACQPIQEHLSVPGPHPDHGGLHTVVPTQQEWLTKPQSQSRAQARQQTWSRTDTHTCLGRDTVGACRCRTSVCNEHTRARLLVNGVQREK